MSGMNVAGVPHAVEARGLVKRFGKTTALAGVDLPSGGVRSERWRISDIKHDRVTLVAICTIKGTQ
jgi:hypothetical protein